jgi:hypothetical protein
MNSVFGTVAPNATLAACRTDEQPLRVELGRCPSLVSARLNKNWVPAFAGTTVFSVFASFGAPQ